MSGRLIAVVGPSGVGKDSLMTALFQSRPEFKCVRRVITRDADLGGEDYIAVDPAQFAEMQDAGAFCLSWEAHGLSYGIPMETLKDVEAGADRLCNLSRKVLGVADKVFPQLVVLNVTARPSTLARRLAGRGRETKEEIAARLSRTVTLPEGLEVATIHNDGLLGQAVEQALAALQPVRA